MTKTFSLVHLLLLVCSLHVLAMLLTWPAVLTITDEYSYVEAARGFAAGRLTSTIIDIDTFRRVATHPSNYPAGTSLVQALCIMVAGWRGVFAVSLLGFVAMIWGCWALLRALGRDPRWTLLLFVFPPLVVLSRTAMSDTVNAALVCGALAFFVRGREGPAWRWWLAGVLAGLILVFREASVLVVAPFFVGALVRRDPGVHRLVLGGLLGAGVRLISAQVLYHNPLFRHPGYGGFGLGNLVHNLPFYLVLTLVVVPFGLVALLRYRGWRWPELLAAALSYTLLHAAYFYGASEGGGPNAIVIGGRYLLPVIPLYIVAIAAAVEQLEARWDTPRSGYQRLLAHRQGLLGSAALLSVAVHPAMAVWSHTQEVHANSLCEYVPADARLVANTSVLAKAMLPVRCERARADFKSLPAGYLARWSRDSRPLFIAIATRTDSEAYMAATVEAKQWLATEVGAAHLRLVHEDLDIRQPLQIWQVTGPL